MPANLQNLINSLRNPTKPMKITQKAFDGETDHYRELCSRRDSLLNKPSECSVELCSYADDLKYMEIQPDLLRFLLPVGLRAWQSSLMDSGKSELAGVAERYSTVLATHKGFCRILSPWEYDALLGFMCDVILDKIDQERQLSFSGSDASPYRWIYAIGTMGMLPGSIPKLWDPWWDISSIGRACAVLQYTSVIMYGENDNPIYAPWTPEKGGGPPVLWDCDANVFDEGWTPDNVECLRSRLTPEEISKSIGSATIFLRDKVESTVPDLMAARFTNVAPMVKHRIIALLRILSRSLGATTNKWPPL